MKTLGFSLALLAALTISACSSPSGPSAEETAQQYLAAQGQGDWATFCQLLSVEDSQTIYRGVFKITKKGKDCTEALEMAPIGLQAQLTETTKGVEIKDVVVDGSQATLRAQTPNGVTSIPMTKIDGQWKIDIGGSEE